MAEPRPRWSPLTKIVISLLLLAFAIYLLDRFSIVLAPFVLAVILAYILNPLVNRLHQGFGLRRSLAVLIAYLLVLAVLLTVPLVILPPLADQFTSLNLDIQRFIEQLEAVLGKQYSIAGRYTLDVDALIRQVVGSLQGLLEPVFGQTLELVVEIISSVVWLIFIVVVSIYLILDGPTLRAWLESLVPPVYRPDYLRIRDEIGEIWGAFFRGQIVLALVVFIIFSVMGLLLGLRFSLAMAVFAGLLEFLPSIGHGIWLFVASLLAFFGGSTWLPLPNWAFLLIVVGLHLVYQQFDLNYLIPRIIGRSVHLRPVVVILGIVAGAALAGVLGILLAAPSIASLRVLMRYVYANLFDMEPFPQRAVGSMPPPNPEWWRKLFPRRTSHP